MHNEAARAAFFAQRQRRTILQDAHIADGIHIDKVNCAKTLFKHALLNGEGCRLGHVQPPVVLHGQANLHLRNLHAHIGTIFGLLPGLAHGLHHAMRKAHLNLQRLAISQRPASRKDGAIRLNPAHAIARDDLGGHAARRSLGQRNGDRCIFHRQPAAVSVDGKPAQDVAVVINPQTTLHRILENESAFVARLHLVIRPLDVLRGPIVAHREQERHHGAGFIITLENLYVANGRGAVSGDFSKRRAVGVVKVHGLLGSDGECAILSHVDGNIEALVAKLVLRTQGHGTTNADARQHNQQEQCNHAHAQFGFLHKPFFRRLGRGNRLTARPCHAHFTPARPCALRPPLQGTRKPGAEIPRPLSAYGRYCQMLYLTNSLRIRSGS